MNYSRKANPNATNSELDAKIIIKHTPKSKYEQFQEWLNECPVQIEEYTDNTDHVIVRFDLPYTPEDDVVKKVEQCIIDTNGAYAECIDHLVESMNDGQNHTLRYYIHHWCEYNTCTKRCPNVGQS